MKHPLQWEFPGGKVEKGESLEACLIREIKEELDIDIAVEKALTTVVFDYGNGYIVYLYPFICRIAAGKPVLREHKQILWLSPAELIELEWVEGDVAVVHEIERLAGQNKY